MADPKYNAPLHKQLERKFKTEIAAGNGWCTEPTCLMPTRHIPPTTPRSGWDIPHNEDGITYRNGPAHARCNRADGGRRRHHPPPPPRIWTL